MMNSKSCVPRHGLEWGSYGSIGRAGLAAAPMDANALLGSCGSKARGALAEQSLQ